MTPDEIAENAQVRSQYLTDVAYCDRPTPMQSEVERDRDLLASPAGTLVIAWLWPQGVYGNDPFAIVASRDRELVESIERRSGDNDEVALQTWTRIVSRRQQYARKVVAARFARMLDSVAKAVERSVADVKAHLIWTVPLAPLDLDRLLAAQSAFPFPVISGICDALGLRFEDEIWWLEDVPRLAVEIDRSMLASEIAEYLKGLGPVDLSTVTRKLPPQTSLARSEHSESYPAPEKRYESLYLELAQNSANNPTYTLEAIDQVLGVGGESPLPPSARDRSWWAGTGAKTEGRPQVGAWWAAGYRIKNMLPRSGDVEVVEFEALPGRDLWLADPARIDRREYRIPDSPPVPIYPVTTRGVEALGSAIRMIASAAEQLMPDQRAMINVLTAALDQLREASRKDDVEDPPVRASVPDDLDLQTLITFLAEAGGATRLDIVEHFGSTNGEVPGDQWMTNLLTKARRQGWIVNQGSRTRPRWALSDHDVDVSAKHEQA